MRKLIRNRKGQGLVEYALIIAGVTLIAAVGISVFGHKVSDMIDAVAIDSAWGSHRRQRPDYERPVYRDDRRHERHASPWIDAATIASSKNQDRLGQNVLGTTTVPKTDSMAW